jgi:signal transduction histidine kinase
LSETASREPRGTAGSGPALVARPADRRRPWLVWGLVVYLAILAAVTASLILLYGDARDRLDEALGARLAGIAQTAAILVDGDSLLVWGAEPRPSLDFLWLELQLERIQIENDLAEVAVCDPRERILISTAGRFAKGERNVFWDLDRAAVQVAKAGFAAVSRLYRVGRVYQKSAHVPILASDGSVAGVLTVEGDADFFDALRRLRAWALGTGAAVLVFLSLMGVFLFRLQAAMERYRASVWRQENLAAMGRMTAGIAHEIRNPLGIIRGAAEHVGRRLAAAGIEDEIAGFIPEEVDRLDRILKGYLAFGGDSPPQLETLDLRAPVRRAAKLAADELARGGVAVALELGEQELTVRVDPHRLQQVLLNLLLNARDAMPEGGTVTVVAARRPDAVVLRVTDEGTGLKGIDGDRLFAPFWTDKEKGSGLGLAMARKIVEEHGGRLVLSDRDDRRGAVAEVVLPPAG